MGSFCPPKDWEAGSCETCEALQSAVFGANILGLKCTCYVRVLGSELLSFLSVNFATSLYDIFCLLLIVQVLSKNELMGFFM